MKKTNFNIKIEGLTDALKDLDKLAKKNLTDATQAIVSTAINIERNSKENLAATEFKESVGDIMKSGYILYSNDKLNADVGFNVGHAPYIEFGTGGLVDVPAGLEDFAMQFIGAGIKEVNIKPRPYFYPAVENEIPKLRKKLQDSLRKS